MIYEPLFNYSIPMKLIVIPSPLTKGSARLHIDKLSRLRTKHVSLFMQKK